MAINGKKWQKYLSSGSKFLPDQDRPRMTKINKPSLIESGPVSFPHSAPQLLTCREVTEQVGWFLKICTKKAHPGTSNLP